MKTIWTMTFALAAVALMLDSSTAQEKKKGFQFGGAFGGTSLTLLENKDVQKDLKLSADQVAKIDELAKKQKDMRDAKDFKGMVEFAKSSKKTIDELLSADQAKRVKQLQLQQRGAGAFGDEKVASELNLTDEQKSKLKDISKSYAEKRAEAFKGFKDNREQATKKLAEINKAMLDDAVAVLNAEQQTKWRAMLGEPFAGTLPPAFGPGGFGGFQGKGKGQFQKKKKTAND